MPLASNQIKSRVAIIRGGTGGLVLGLCLKEYAHDVRFDIYESAAQLAITGSQDRAGFSLVYRKSDEGNIVEISRGTEQLHAFHRSLLQQLLVKHLDARGGMYFSKLLVSYSES